ncbi:phospho-N-acetylmuramoyl-pentapeptide-transferase [Thermonema lapsum]|uniref:Phospho-N-acetylmuramoyl-pentapeptide-transferase n=1 Tax=Thermonema lapsum TaxID=28195 RepID=A0A846MPD8_9BACT|nr:phospho-N-acetylmuramoyl-pentapeptide-transferase [Thermonema lapsum]NIK73325.1 phospho-N-acetylmuramoyl-pentapeptide-transferase [Thermonema lapsum]
MLYYLFTYLDREFDLIGAGVFRYISFRGSMAAVFSLLIATVLGKRIIAYLKKQQIGEKVRELGLAGQSEKQGTPTMGGLIILLAIFIPVLLFADLSNIYVILLLVTSGGLGIIGFVDDYLKLKKSKEGLSGKLKILGQVVIGIIVGATLFFHEEVVLQENIPVQRSEQIAQLPAVTGQRVVVREGKAYFAVTYKSTKTNVPFMKNNEFDYEALNIFGIDWLTPLIYILVVTFIITAVSNGANITDGIDGLAAGTSAIIGTTLAIFAYLSGNVIFSDYLNVLYIPNLGEAAIFCTAFTGACVGFLWYNAYPAQVFMGDTGSLSLGGTIAVLALCVRKELLLPLLCGIFLIENLSVMIQVGYFKYTKRKYGEGRRVFKMAPLHHHYQKLGYHEAKIVTRFWIVGIMLAILTLVTLKLR